MQPLVLATFLRDKRRPLRRRLFQCQIKRRHRARRAFR
jgi:hypothetical protein